MRIIAGTAGRIPIQVPASVTRPTTDLVRQAIFNILGEAVVNSRVLDLFCGSGALGLEALSRGASSATMIDSNSRALAITKKNVARTRLDKVEIVKSDALKFLERVSISYDLIFADPPYFKQVGDVDHITKILPSLPKVLAPEGYLILETAARFPTPYDSQLNLIDQRDYGSTRVHFFAHSKAPT